VGANSSSTCADCTKPNAYSQAGSAQCSTCPPGTALTVKVTNIGNDTANSTGLAAANVTNSTITSLDCVDCPSGTYRTASEDKCTACEAGMLQARRVGTALPYAACTMILFFCGL
jgi:hypothetical protein